MKYAVVGSRDWPDASSVARVLDSLTDCEEVISGGAAGVDTLAAEWARAHSVPLTVFPAEWSKYGKSAGYRRNVAIVAAADAVLAFQYRQSRGTQHSIDIAIAQGKLVHLWEA